MVVVVVVVVDVVVVVGAVVVVVVVDVVVVVGAVVVVVVVGAAVVVVVGAAVVVVVGLTTFVLSVALDGNVFWMLAGMPTVTVLDSVPVKPELIVALMVKVMTPPSGTVTVVLIFPTPAALPQAAPPAPPQVQLMELSAAGMVSVTAALTTVMSADPLFVRVMV